MVHLASCASLLIARSSLSALAMPQIYTGTMKLPSVLQLWMIAVLCVGGV